MSMLRRMCACVLGMGVCVLGRGVTVTGRGVWVTLRGTDQITSKLLDHGRHRRHVSPPPFGVIRVAYPKKLYRMPNIHS